MDDRQRGETGTKSEEVIVFSVFVLVPLCGILVLSSGIEKGMTTLTN